jgi:excinuclease ABC subunit A
MNEQDTAQDHIRILGASQNNLKDVDVAIPLHSLTVITGVSGSGKSSLAFDTLYAEGQRRYLESMSAYARQFLARIQKPAVKEIRGISPAIAIRQKSSTRNPRSTVATVTEIYDFLRLLYSRVGIVHCRICGQEVRKDTIDVVVDDLLRGRAGSRAYITFPLAGSALDLTVGSPDRGPEPKGLLDHLLKRGFHRLVPSLADPSSPIHLSGGAPVPPEELLGSHVLVDRLILDREARDRLTDSLEMSFAEGNGIADVTVLSENGFKTLRFSERFECRRCNQHYRAPEPRLFSFNNPFGACPTCQGFGNTMNVDRDLVIPEPTRTLLQGPVEPFLKPRYRRYQKHLVQWAERHDIPLDVPFEKLPESIQDRIWEGSDRFPGVLGFFKDLTEKKYKMHVRIFISRYRGFSRCPDCRGERLCREARDVQVGGKRISQVTQMAVSEALRFFGGLELSRERREIAGRLLDEVAKRLEFLRQTGLDYLTLDRLTSSLSGGEMQRIHLAASLGSSLAGTLYVLDEPSIGLHPRDQARLVEILRRLRDLDNTMVVVEHEREIITSADHVIDMGPGAGELGGRVLFSGNLSALLDSPDSLTGRYLRGDLRIATPVFRRKSQGRSIVLKGVRQNNLRDLDIRIPLGILACVTGVSGSGKSTLVQDVLYAGVQKLRGEWNGPAGRARSIEGWEQLTEVLLVDQGPIGRTPRSNPVTYIKAFDDIRQIFASLREAQARNLKPGHFSFNIAGGRCEACQGSGSLTVEMQFLADVELQCEECRGTRYQKKVLEVTYKGRSIDQVLGLTVREALTFFSSHPSLVRRLKVLQDVGLEYLRLGQSATTLSGGEAQRIKLAAYLSRRTTRRPLFILDEPTTGLHVDDIGKLLRSFDRLIAAGATVLVIEHNLEVIKCADWIIDLGPEGGDAGGRIVVEGTPEEVAACEQSHTGRFLRPLLLEPSDARTAESA